MVHKAEGLIDEGTSQSGTVMTHNKHLLKFYESRKSLLEEFLIEEEKLKMEEEAAKIRFKHE